MKIDEVEKICEEVNNILDDLKRNQCNVSTKEKGWETYYGLDDELIKYIRKIEKENKKYKEVLDKTKEDLLFIKKSIQQEKDMSTDSRTRREMTTCIEIINELLEEINE